MSEKIFDRISKLLALATSPNEHEARLAAEKANELLVRHNLTAQEVRHQTETKYVENAVQMGTPNLRVEDKFIASIVRNHFFCRPCFVGAKIINGRYQRTILFVGEETNAKIGAYVYEFLFRKYRELWTDYRKQTGAKQSDRQSYYLGLTDGLGDQLKARRKIIEDEMALAVVPDRKLDAYMRSMSSETKTKFSASSKSPAAEAGFQQGKNLKISRGLESASASSSAPLRLGGG